MAMSDIAKARYRCGQYAKQRILHKALRILAVKKLGGKCNRCGFSDFRALQIDHIDSCGMNGLGRDPDYNRILKNILNDSDSSEKYQILCANCNWIKRSENDEVHRIYPIDGYNSGDFSLSDLQADIADWEAREGISGSTKA